MKLKNGMWCNANLKNYEALKNLGLDDTFYINNPKTESSQDFEIVTVILPKYKAFQAKIWELEFLNSRLSNPSKSLTSVNL